MSLLVLPSPARSIRMVQRNLLVYKHGWMVILSGFFEPVLYLLSIGLGLGGFVTQVDGVSYTAFIAPGLLASSCMNGAVSDGFFNIFFKLHFQKTYDGILATPMRVADIAFGEMLWALTRGALYSVGFLAVMAGVGAWQGAPILLSWTALWALPAVVLIAASFSALALCVTSVVRRVEQFDIVMGLCVIPMFLFSGTFFPLSQAPAALRWLMQVVPLYHGVALLRALTTGRIGWVVGWHVAYLVVVGVGAFVVAMRRLERTLIA